MEFSWTTDVDIVKNSCFEVKCTDELNDLRLGASIKENCQTCFSDWNKCSGHFGHYRLMNIPLVHPLMVSAARKALKTIGTARKIKISQNSLQILKEGEWKVLTYYDIEKDLNDYLEAEESRKMSDFHWLRWAVPISPPCLRPTCYTPERGTSFNDITHRLSSIVRMDKALQQSIDMNPNNKVEHRRYAVRLQLAYTLLFFVPQGARESRELSAIADRFKGKEGRLRQSLMGKRITFSARTVITGDPCLRLTELGVPIEVAEKLTKPVRVAAYNYEYLEGLLAKQQIKYVNRAAMRFNPVFRKVHLKVGDLCHVKLQDGMRVLFNRQPTLWYSSVQCLYVRRMNRKTFSINCEITPAFNADFDGDEMNMFVPQTIEAEGELECLMQSREHLLCGGQGVVQDTALGCYLLSLEDCSMTKNTFFKCLYLVLTELDRDKGLEMHFSLEAASRGPFTGRTLLSCLFGDRIDKEGLVEKGTVVGVLDKGTVKKKLMPLVQEHYGKKELGHFLYLLSRISAEFLRRRGFSVGLSSLESWKTTEGKVDIEEETKEFVETVQTKDEWLLLRLGNLYKSKKALKTKSIFSDDNPMLVLGGEKSGAKGSLLNLIQIRSSLGQQYYKGGLIRMFRNNRILSSEPLQSGKQTQDQQLARRGFISSNFLKGLNPTECMLHAMTSRLSLLDTALKTSETGYASRRLGKSLEDCIVQYDNTLRNGDRVLLFDVEHFKHQDLQPGHALGIIASQSIGQRVMQLTLNSVDWCTDLIVRWHAYNEAPMHGSVGLMIDALMKQNNPSHPDPAEPTTTYLELPEGHAEALTVDESGQVSWKPLLAVTRHPPKNKDGSNMLLKVTTKSGRTVTCTKAKSFLVVENGQVTEISGEDLRVGHRLPVTYTLPPTDTCHLDLRVYLNKKKTLFTSSCVAAHESMVSGRKSWFPPHKATLPYSRSDGCRAALNKFKHLLQAGFVYPKVGHHSAAGIPECIELTRAFGFFIGAYLAEGCLTEHQVHISNNDPEYRKAAAEWPSSLGINHHETLPKHMHKNGGISMSIMFHSSLLVRILRRVCGSGAFEKKVPVCAFSAPKPFVCGLLDAYISGDGSVSKNGAISAGSRSEKLIDNMMLLMHRIGVPSTRMTFAVKEKPNFALYVRLLHAQQFARMVTLTDKGKMKRLLEAKPKNGFRKRAIQYCNDVMLDAVKSIEEVPSSHPFVYDLTVADTKNMVDGSGLGLRDTFHTAGTACLEVSDGVPRMEALINVWSKKLRSNRLLEIGDIDAWTGHQYVRKHGSVMLKELMLQRCKVVRVKEPPPNCSQYALKILLDEIACKKNRLCAWDIEVAIRKTKLYPELIPVSRATAVTLFFQSKLEKIQAKLELIDRLAPQLSQINIRQQSTEMKMSWSQNTLQLKGIALKDAFTTFSSIWHRVCSTDTVEVLEHLGIEACRATLLRELNKVFNDGVREIYLLTLCEWMCWLGKLCPVTRNGILMSNDNAFKNMAFEQTLKTAVRNASNNAVADFSGTSERIIVNNFVKQGTGLCGLVEVPQEILADEVKETVLVAQDDEDDIYGGIAEQSFRPGPKDTSWFFQNYSSISGAGSLWSG